MGDSSKFNRRGFLRSTALTGAGFLALGSAESSGFKPTLKKRKFVYRELGKTGIKLPVVSMGVMRADNPSLVKGALDAGIVHFDTAHGYQGGKNEEMLGQVFSTIPRKSIVVATKISLPKKEGEFTQDATPERLNEMFRVSLQRLKMDYVDILYLHGLSTRRSVMYEPVVNAALKLKEEGRIRFLGVSTHSKEPEVIHAMVESGVYDVVLTSYNFMQDHVEQMNNALEAAYKAGIGVVAMKTMAGGFLDREKKNPVNTRAALKWALQNPHVSTAIPGFTSFEHLEDSLSVMENLKLNSDETKDLQLGMTLQGIYCQGCKVCQGKCPQDLPIPDLMRSFMYAYGYRDLRQAQDTLMELNLPQNPCGDCNECLVQCAKGFDIAGKVKDIVRVKDIPTEFLV